MLYIQIGKMSLVYFGYKKNVLSVNSDWKKLEMNMKKVKEFKVIGA